MRAEPGPSPHCASSAPMSNSLGGILALLAELTTSSHPQDGQSRYRNSRRFSTLHCAGIVTLANIRKLRDPRPTAAATDETPWTANPTAVSPADAGLGRNASVAGPTESTGRAFIAAGGTTSSSSGGTRTTATSVSPSSSCMIRTPCVLRPMTLMSAALIRWILPRAVIISTSSRSSTRAMPMTGPLRSVALISRTPIPPRPLVG